MRFAIKIFAVLAAFLLLANSISLARNVDKKTNADKQIRIETPAGYGYDGDLLSGQFFAPAAQSTTWIAVYTFETGSMCDQQGWVGVDETEQPGVYFHIDDFAGLGGGTYGLLLPLEGSQSLWCGAAPDTADPEFCTYAVLPGYGNGWKQAFRTVDCLSVSGDITISYMIVWDSEPGYDYTWLQYDTCDGDWQNLVVYDDTGQDQPVVVVGDSLHNNHFRARFYFESDGAWSDQDGLWDSDGAVIIDSLSVADTSGVVLPVETFETEQVGDQTTASGNWEAWVEPGYGDYSGLFPGILVVQEDPCVSNMTCFWGFFNGSTYNYACGGFSNQQVVPYVDGQDRYIANSVWSPRIPWAGTGDHVVLEFDVYRDLQLRALIFYTWSIRTYVDGCLNRWQDRDFVYYGPGKDWLHSVNSIGDFFYPGVDEVQIVLKAHDMCRYWCGIYGDGYCHSHSPLFDNVKLYRVELEGPQWNVRDIDTFQDNFSNDGTITGTARADMANDIKWSSSSGILPGDSSVVTVNDPTSGLAGDPITGFGPAVYAYIYVNPPQAGKSGGALTQDPLRWPVVGSQLIGGDTWFKVRMDTVFSGGTGGRTGYPQPERFCIDLNDDLFTPGDTVFFFYGATSAAPSNVTNYFSLPIANATRYTFSTGSTPDINEAAANADEFTILPSGGFNRGGDILYVDGMNFRGAQPYFDTAFDLTHIRDLVDRYDIRGPSSAVSNRLGGRVKNEFTQIIPVYRKIIWNTGDLPVGTIGDGTGDPEKADDARVLYNFLDNLVGTGGIYFSGDDLAEEWDQLQGIHAVNLKNVYMNFDVTTGDHTDPDDFNNVGISPLVVGVFGGCFYDTTLTGADDMIAYGGCPIINNFDVLSTGGGASFVEANYVGNGNTAPAILSQVTNNSSGFDVGVILSGFSFHYIRDDDAGAIPDRVQHLTRVLQWMDNVISIGTGVESNRLRTSLDQNYPNPFNPVTTITYSLKERAHVSLKIYNVAGQLVRSLVDDVQSPQSVRPIEWRGRNNAGQTVSSGVYFYRLVTKDFTQTRKMVLLK